MAKNTINLIFIYNYESGLEYSQGMIIMKFLVLFIFWFLDEQTNRNHSYKASYNLQKTIQWMIKTNNLQLQLYHGSIRNILFFLQSVFNYFIMNINCLLFWESITKLLIFFVQIRFQSKGNSSFQYYQSAILSYFYVRLKLYQYINEENIKIQYIHKMDSAILQQVFIIIFNFIYIYSQSNQMKNITNYDAPEIIYLLLQLKIQNTIFSQIAIRDTPWKNIQQEQS
ncbi:hypothetical protein pb186bvf_008286 [Paramecium bursaria]